MSLLIPTECDYEDAHGGDPKQEEIYKEEIAKLQKTTDTNFPWKFEVVPGFFKQSDDSTDDLKFNYATDNFGRIGLWEEIIARLQELNKNAADNEVYKLLFLARHGQGYHNVIVNKYGIEQWNKKWHSLTTDGELIYAPDPMLTDLGISQAKENNQAWREQLKQGAPIPSKFYVSPLQRSCHTVVHTWDGIKPTSLHPLVYEGVRETLGLNLCDKRSTRTVICERFEKPHGFNIDDTVTENDELYKDDYRETLVEQSIRLNKFLQYLFEQDFTGTQVNRSKALDDIFVSITSHAGTIRSFITVLGHRHFTISTGGMIPIVVKATRTK